MHQTIQTKSSYMISGVDFIWDLCSYHDKVIEANIQIFANIHFKGSQNNSFFLLKEKEIGPLFQLLMIEKGCREDFVYRWNIFRYIETLQYSVTFGFSSTLSTFSTHTIWYSSSMWTYLVNRFRSLQYIHISSKYSYFFNIFLFLQYIPISSIYSDLFNIFRSL